MCRQRGQSRVGAEIQGCQAKAPGKNGWGEGSEESAVTGNDREGQDGGGLTSFGRAGWLASDKAHPRNEVDSAGLGVRHRSQGSG